MSLERSASCRSSGFACVLFKLSHSTSSSTDINILPQVDWSGNSQANTAFEIGNPQRFGQDFVDRVANPRDIVQFHRKNAANRPFLLNPSPFPAS